MFSEQKTGKFKVHILCSVYGNLVNNCSQFIKQSYIYYGIVIHSLAG